MQISLAYGGQLLGEVDFGAPDERGVRLGTLRPSAAYFPLRPRLQQPMLNLMQMRGASGEEIRAQLLHEHAQLAAEGLMLIDAAGDRLPTDFLQVTELAPLDTAPDIVEAIGIQVTARFAPAT